jgi:ATP-dependent RNA helicase RhlB
MSEHLLTDVSFSSLDLVPELLKGTQEAGFEFCTPIQAGALPKALGGHDVEGQAQTGTGKTAAFLLATMNRLLTRAPVKGHRDGDPRALIMAPTRELAVQIHKDAKVLGKYTDLRVGVVFGGTAYDQQREMLRAGLDILIGTPGRTIDYFKQHIYSLNGIQVAVIDEADRMFDLGFIRDIRYVLRRMPPPEERLNLLFSATLSMKVSELAYEHMNSPTVVNATPDQMTVSKVSHVLYHVSKEEKIPLLVGLLKGIDTTRTMVFVNTKRSAEAVEAYLEGNGLHAGMLTGDVPQRKRLALLEKFTRGEMPILVATDVASRGLHIPDVSHIVNFDLPQDAEDYVHRVGRTARAGASGDAVSFACEDYVYSLMDIEEFIGAKIPTAAVTEDLLVRLEPPARRSRKHKPPPGGGGGGGRRRRSSPGRARTG